MYTFVFPFNRIIWKNNNAFCDDGSLSGGSYHLSTPHFPSLSLSSYTKNKKRKTDWNSYWLSYLVIFYVVLRRLLCLSTLYQTDTLMKRILRIICLFSFLLNLYYSFLLHFFIFSIYRIPEDHIRNNEFINTQNTSKKTIIELVIFL